METCYSTNPEAVVEGRNYGGPNPYYCHTASDLCINDSDCAPLDAGTVTPLMTFTRTLRLQRAGQSLGVHPVHLRSSVTLFLWRRHGSEQFTFEKAPSPCQKHWTRLGLGLELADNLLT
jgi:hypothetical protein